MFQVTQYFCDSWSSILFRLWWYILKIFVELWPIIDVKVILFLDKLSFGLFLANIFLKRFVIFLQSIVCKTHQLRLTFVELYILHTNRCRMAFVCLLRVYNRIFVLSVFLQMFVFYVGVDCSQRTVDLSAFADVRLRLFGLPILLLFTFSWNLLCSHLFCFLIFFLNLWFFLFLWRVLSLFWILLIILELKLLLIGLSLSLHLF